MEKPVWTSNVAGLRAELFERVHENRTYHSLRLSRGYKGAKGEWHEQVLTLSGSQLQSALGLLLASFQATIEPEQRGHAAPANGHRASQPVF